jgi:hypothetical protein
MVSSVFVQIVGVLFFTLASPAEALMNLPDDLHFAADTCRGSCVLTLEDFSEWKVSSKDQNTLFSWYSQNAVVPITISPNYFSCRYSYYLTNQNTGSYVRANLVGAPLRDSEQAVTINGFDRYGHEKSSIYLSNGTYWLVSKADMSLTKNWFIDDLIIIGNNSDWLSYNTHILINIHTNTYVRAQRL